MKLKDWEIDLGSDSGLKGFGFRKELSSTSSRTISFRPPEVFFLF